jgi:tetratricopeptide (TPR) repeat protein
MRSRVQLSLGDVELATRDIEAAVAVEPNLGQSELVRARLHAFAGSPGTSITLLSEYIAQLQIKPRTASAPGGRPDTQPSPADEEQALTAQKQELGRAFVQLGEVLQQIEHFEDAITSYEKALTLNHAQPDAFCKLGECFIEVGEHELAREAFSCCLDQMPRHAKAL